MNVLANIQQTQHDHLIGVHLMRLDIFAGLLALCCRESTERDLKWFLKRSDKAKNLYSTSDSTQDFFRLSRGKSFINFKVKYINPVHFQR